MNTLKQELIELKDFLDKSRLQIGSKSQQGLANHVVNSASLTIATLLNKHFEREVSDERQLRLDFSNAETTNVFEGEKP